MHLGFTSVLDILADSSICLGFDYSCSWNCSLDFFSFCVVDSDPMVGDVLEGFSMVILNRTETASVVSVAKVTWNMPSVACSCRHLGLSYLLQSLLFLVVGCDIVHQVVPVEEVCSSEVVELVLRTGLVEEIEKRHDGVEQC